MMHPDFITWFDGIEYFFLGNGDIEAAVQHSPKDRRASFFGLTLFTPDHFCRKWSTFLYHPEAGLGNSRLTVQLDEQQPAGGATAGPRSYFISPESLAGLEWLYPDGVPAVTMRWTAGPCAVQEEFFTPSEGSLLFRRVSVTNNGPNPAAARVSLYLYANFGLFDEIRVDESEHVARADGWIGMKLLALAPNPVASGRYEVAVDLGTLAPGQKAETVYAYALAGAERILTQKPFAAIWDETSKYWKGRSSVRTGNKVLDDLAGASRTGLRAVAARGGKMDAGTWMYNMEWVGDQAIAVEAFLRYGFVDEARVMIERNLRDNIGPDGRTIESSRWFGYDYTEINQNGIMLYGVWSYLAWTGDLDLVRKYWDRIKLCGDFPLSGHFLDPQTHMVRNKREFWERNDSQGVKPGYELAYQAQVANGLMKGAAIARLLGDRETAGRWSGAAEQMKNAILHDPKFRLIEDGHFIKRRTVAGEWQRSFIPPDRSRMPRGSPLAVEPDPSPEPDTTEVYPALYGLVDPAGDIARNTLRWVEQLWNQRWDIGGYSRYNATSEDNPPAPWPIASLLVARAYAAAGDDEKTWRVLRWLHDIHGGKSGSWFERYGQSITPPMPPVCVVGWVWYEVIALLTEQVMGFRPGLEALTIAPRLLSGLDEIKARETVRGSSVSLTLRRSGEASRASVNGRPVTLSDGTLTLKYPLEKEVTIVFDVKTS